jgi:hypothetical protein
LWYMPTPRTTNGRFSERPKGLNGEKSGQQSTAIVRFPSANVCTTKAVLWSNGGDLNNPMGFPGYGSLYTGSYLTYRWILQHPVVRFVRAIRNGPILASSWEYAALRKGTPQAWVDEVKQCFDLLRPRLIRDFYIRGCDFGWQGGEVIWGFANDNSYTIERVKPLLQDVTTILHDKFGNFSGLENGLPPEGEGESPRVYAPYKAFLYTYDSEAGYLYGRSWLENIRATAWKDWLDCAQQLQKLASKISGIVTLIQSPAGEFPTGDPQNPKMSFQQAAIEVIGGLAGGAAGAWYPSLTLTPDSKGNIDIVKYISELAGKSLTKFEVLDFGKQSAAIGPILDRMKHNEENIFAGGLRSSRVGMQGSHGTQAEADVHTDTGTINAEEEDEEFAYACQPLVDALLVANHGPRAKGAVGIRPPSLIDRKAQVLRAILMALLAEPGVRIEASKSLDIDKMFSVIDAPQKKPFDGDAAEKSGQKKQPTAGTNGRGSQPNPEGGRPTNRVKVSSRRRRSGKGKINRV